MNRYQLLQEMGITPWVLKNKDLKNSPDLNKSINQDQPNISRSYNCIMTSSDITPEWILVAESSSITSPLFNKIVLTIEKFGVKTTTVPFTGNNWKSNQVKGNFLIAFGEKVGQFFSNEPATVDGLREIIFGASNHEEEEIPVIVSYSISDLLKNPKLKKSLWNDLVFARSVYLETYM
jgi:hypothetical protein